MADMLVRSEIELSVPMLEAERSTRSVVADKGDGGI